MTRDCHPPALPPATPKNRKGTCLLHNCLGEFGVPFPTSTTPVQSQPQEEHSMERTGFLQWHNKMTFCLLGHHILPYSHKTKLLVSAKATKGISPAAQGTSHLGLQEPQLFLFPLQQFLCPGSSVQQRGAPPRPGKPASEPQKHKHEMAFYHCLAWEACALPGQTPPYWSSAWTRASNWPST